MWMFLQFEEFSKNSPKTLKSSEIRSLLTNYWLVVQCEADEMIGWDVFAAKKQHKASGQSGI